MKKYILLLAGTLGLMGCSGNKSYHKENMEDSVVVHGIDKNLVFSLDSFEHIKDSFIYVNDSHFYIGSDGFWCTKEFHRWNFEYPDTITVAFTRDGVFEDSVKCERRGLVEDSTGNYYSPAYIFTTVVGDSWTYDVNGKFIRFDCSSSPHSGRPHHYKP